MRSDSALLTTYEKRAIVLLAASLLGACHASIPNDLAQAVLMEEIGQLDGMRMGFVPCVSIDSVDADASTLESLRKVYPSVVPAPSVNGA